MVRRSRPPAPPTTQSAGTTTVTGTGKLSSNETVTLTGGTLSGTGTVAANVSNGATVTPGSSSSPGMLTISGNYTQTSAGTLSVDVAGTAAGTGYGQLVVTGSVSLAGTLTLQSITATTRGTPTRSSTIRLRRQKAGPSPACRKEGLSRSGPALYSVTYMGGTGNDFVVTTVSLPDTWVGGTSGNWNTASNWSKGTVPASSDNVVIGSGRHVTLSSGASPSPI